ncbi:MAG: riboflavin synthase [Ekhidna sp.]|nr:riboflavin synthase [Ekhidna sp.]
MFTGIVESVGKVERAERERTNIHFQISSSISDELKIDQSVSHNGVCLTVTKVGKNTHWVTAIDETVKKSNIGNWTTGTPINLERCMRANGRFDGHIVQGHVDTTATVASIEDKEGSWIVRFNLKEKGLVVEKGSICINGTSLTCFEVDEACFSVAIIPYTYQNTNFNQVKIGDAANIEFDIIGKYISRILNKK